jgi:hypothetical protein
MPEPRIACPPLVVAVASREDKVVRFPETGELCSGWVRVFFFTTTTYTATLQTGPSKKVELQRGPLTG